MQIRQFLILASATAMAACSGNSPSLSPSPLGGQAPARMAVSHEHDHGVASTIISIVGSVGTASFMPNPAPVAPNTPIVWKNNDLVPHNLVLTDGVLSTPVGMIEPGASSLPVMMAGGTISYYCTLHPSMTGIVHDPAVPPPPPAVDPGAGPGPIPGPYPMPGPNPMPDPYPYPSPDDGYYDDY